MSVSQDGASTCRCATTSDSDGAAAGLPAEARAGAELRAHPGLRLRLHPLHRRAVLHRLQDPARLHTWVGFGELRATLSAHPQLDHRAEEPRRSSRSLYIVICTVLGPGPRHPARPEDPRRRRAAADLSLSDGAVLHRHRRRLEMVPRSRHRPRARHASAGAGRASPSAGSRTARWRSTRIVIAAVWQSSGFVMAMFLAGLRGVDNEIIKAAQIDGASTFTHLPPHHHPADAAGLPLGLRRARASRDQVLRPGRRADRRRAGHARPGLPANFM